MRSVKAPINGHGRASAIVRAVGVDVIVAAVAATLAACGGGPQLDRGASHLDGGASQLYTITQAVVRSDDRTVLVPTEWDACSGQGPHLEAAELADQVTLTLIGPVGDEGPSCPGPAVFGQAQTVLGSPVGQRTLIDKSTGSGIPTVFEDQLPPVTVLPAGYSYSGIVPRNEAGAIAGGPPSVTRTYSSSEKSLAPLWISQFPGTSATQAEASWDPGATTSVHGQPAIVQYEPASSPAPDPVSRWVIWAEDGWILIVDSPSQSPEQLPLSEAQVLTVAQGIEMSGPDRVPALL
ncbi:MAG: hypothetical protein ACLQGJ_01635 [Candidatus Dormibacteria bacterium]